MKVLMICYGYPPIGGAGMIRPLKFAKFLPQFGWQPTVLTPQEGIGRIPCPKEMGDLPGVTVVRTPYTNIISAFKQKLGWKQNPEAVETQNAPLTQAQSSAKQTKRGALGKARLFAYELVTMPDEHIGWYHPAMEVGRGVLRKEKFDLIFTTSPPETSHLIARSLKDEFAIPWVAELRDPWSFDHYRKHEGLKAWMLRKLEKAVFRDADALITVSDVWQNELSKLHNREIFCIPHGFDLDDYPSHMPPSAKEFTILYAGSLDKDYQNPEMLLAVLSELIKDQEIDPAMMRVNFHVYGSNLPDFDELIEKYSLKGVIKKQPLLEYGKCLAAQKSSTVLLVFQWRGDIGSGVQNVKGYEYLGARRPSLVIGAKEGVFSRLMRETKGGETPETPVELRAVLLKWHEEFRKTGTVKFTGDDTVIAQYTRRAQTAKLVKVFEYALRHNSRN